MALCTQAVIQAHPTRESLPPKACVCAVDSFAQGGVVNQTAAASSGLAGGCTCAGCFEARCVVRETPAASTLQLHTLSLSTLWTSLPLARRVVGHILHVLKGS